MLDTLFGLIPAASLGQQWLAEELQLINWGGYDGAHRIRFSPTATLLCGGSGSGKSTLMDAYIALMMPHTTPFNGASNGAVTGRPRSDEQRNILSYGRGKLDESRTDAGTQARVLRGDGVDTWSAVAMTWVNHDGARFTAIRAWYIPAGARTMDDVPRTRAVAHDSFELVQLERAAAKRFSDTAVKALALEPVATDREFSARLHSVLGIGAAGAGAKAMSLLARIQAGQQITTVDELYKRMVLEEPETLAIADAVVSHFDELESTRQRMLTAERQVRMLRPIRGYRERIERSAEQLRLLDSLGSFSDADSLAVLWRNERRLELTRAVEAELKRRKQRLDDEVRAQQALADTERAQCDALAEVLRSSGGGRLETAERELEHAQRRLDEVRGARQRFEEAIVALGVTVDSSAVFAELRERAQAALADEHGKLSARDAYAQARGVHEAWRARLAELETDQRQTKRRRGNLPAAHYEARDQLAEAAGLSSADLPFVGELVEVLTEYEPWREAFNLALGGFATTLLIDQGDLRGFRAAINDVQLKTRLRFEGVHTGLQRRHGLDSRLLPGRLEYADSPFTGWLQDHLVKKFDFVCVNSVSELHQHARALTIGGQISQGSRGAHGGHGFRNVLGFSNHRRLAELAEEIATTKARLAAAQEQLTAAVQALNTADAAHEAYKRVVDTTWASIDVVSLEREHERWQRLCVEITGGNPQIAQLKAQLEGHRAKAAEHAKTAARAEGERDRIEGRWAEIVQEVDEAQAVLDEARGSGRELSEEQTQYLAERFDPAAGQAGDDPREALRRLDAALLGAAQRLAEEQLSAQETLVEQREHLRRTLQNFLENWPNPSLRADPDTSVKDFERILQDLETSGLHELEQEWKTSLLKLSGNDLANLHSALDRALREIRERIEPINVIMQNLPFYDDGHRLQITPRESQSEVRRRFRKELRDVRALIEAAATDEARHQAYERMAKLIDRIRRGAPDFAELIDARNHVRVSAEKIDALTKEHVSLYDHIGEKSGGESQELIAFIVGAALRYQLGDAAAERPRYAPVFLDEALIKADAHFTKRAIGAWRGLGFQLIIGAPNDKYSAIEPHVDVEYDILKDTMGRSWAKPKVGLPENS